MRKKVDIRLEKQPQQQQHGTGVILRKKEQNIRNGRISIKTCGRTFILECCILIGLIRVDRLCVFVFASVRACVSGSVCNICGARQTVKLTFFVDLTSE